MKAIARVVDPGSILLKVEIEMTVAEWLDAGTPGTDANATLQKSVGQAVAQFTAASEASLDVSAASPAKG